MNARAWTLFAAVSTLWGIPYLFIKIGVDGGMPPVVLAWGRIVLAAIVLLGLAARKGVLGQARGRLRALIGYAVLEISIPFPLIAAGERHVSSSLAAIIIASVPLIVALLALRFDAEERADRRRLTGLVIGLAGVALLVGLDASSSLPSLLAAAGILVAAVGYAAGPMILKRGLDGVDPRTAMGVSLALAALLLSPLALVDLPSRAPTARALASVVVLGLVCTALAFVLMALLIREIGPARSVVITYVNPVIAVALGVVLLGERPGAAAIAGLILILGGSWLSTDGRTPRRLIPRSHRERAEPADRHPPMPGAASVAGQRGRTPADAHTDRAT